MFELDHSLKKELDERWKESQSLWQQWWYEADLDTKMATGQQDYWNSFYNVNYRNQKVLMFNKILRVLNMIGGYQRKNRLGTIISAADNDEDSGMTADQLTRVMMWCMRQDDTYEKISQCFDGSNIQGLNLLSVWMDYRQDPENGEVKTSRIPFNAFLMDNYWTRHDLSDCDWIWTRHYMSRNQVISLFPKIQQDLPILAKGYGAKDGRFQFLAQNWYQYQQELFAYDEYWTRDYRPVKKILDQFTGELIDWRGTNDQFDAFKAINPNIKLIKVMQPTVRRRVLINNHLIDDEIAPYGSDRYPFVPFCCYHFPEVQNYAYRYQGIVRNIRDSQIELNRRRNRMLDIYDAQVQSGLMVKENALVNPEDAFKQGPGQAVFFRDSANLATDVVQIQPPQIPPSVFELQQMLDKEIMEIAGATEELFGDSTNGKDMSGFLTQLRMGAALVSLQKVFDQLNVSQKILGEVFLDMVQANFGEAKIRSILGQEPAQQFKSMEFAKFHVAVEEAQLTTTQRQLQFIQALQMRQLGIPISSKYLIEKSTLQGKKEIIEDILAQEQQAAQMQQLQFQAEMQQQQIATRALEAKAQNDFASAEERKTRAVSNIGLAKERASQSVHDRAKAALENSKALHELSQMDEDRLIKLSSFILDLQAKQKSLQGGEEGDSIAEAEALSDRIGQKEYVTTPDSMKSQELMGTNIIQ